MDEKTYKNFVAPYEYATNEMVASLQNMQDELLRSTTIRNPIDSIHWRIKTLESINEKCSKAGYDLDLNNLEQISLNMLDIAGIRIVCIFKDDIWRIQKYIEKIPGVFILKTKDYVTKPKPNGYSSLHLIVYRETATILEGIKKIPIEVQIRTIAQQQFAQIEHRARYKNTQYGSNSSNLESMLQAAAEMSRDLDELYNAIRKESGED